MSTKCLTVVRVVGCLAALGLGAQVFAADQPGTYFKADLNLVQTVGNSQAGTLGAKANFTENWLRSGFTMNAGGVRTETTQTSRTATGTSQSDMTIQEISLSKTSAENYFVDAQYSYRLTESFYWFTKGSWARDNPAGVTSRFMEMTGFGYDLAKKDGAEFKLNAAATLTQETDKVVNPNLDQKNFPGVQVNYAYKQKVSSTTTLTHNLVFDLPFSTMDNWRLDGQAGIEVSMTRSGTLGLKLDARVQYRNMPALEELQLNGTQTKVTNPLHKVDAQLTAALTVNLSRKGGMTRVTGH
jgi:putative salt-induced outer membrane protein YdiY